MGKMAMRRGAFETNSSSEHVLVIDTSGNHVSPPDGEVLVSGGSYGWEMETYADVQSRADYLWECVLESCYGNPDDSGVKSAWQEAIREFIPGAVFVENEDPYHGIDHGGETYGFIVGLWERRDLLEDFLLGRQSAVFTGNDNDGDPQVEYPDGPYIEYEKGN